MNLLFISDLHLSPERPAVTRAFFRFLEQQATRVDGLYILGDLFEAWIGDDDPSTLAREVVAALRTLSDRGVAVYFQHGNRDFLVGQRFAEETGCTLLPDYQILESHGRRLVLLHGDTLCLDDVKYQKFRRKVRNPVYRWCLRHLPLKKRMQIASEWRLKSKKANSNKASNIMDVTPNEVERVMTTFDAGIMIHGHTHRPARHQHNAGERLVLGDWADKGWYIELTEDDLRLENFAIGMDAGQ